MPTRFAILSLIACLILGCAVTTSAPLPTPVPLNVALALARGGLGDKAFNDSAYSGLQKAEKELGVKIATIEFKDGDAQIDQVRDAAKSNFNLIIAIGSENANAIRKVAAEFPNKSFAIIDTSVDAPNVASITFRELEGDFLAGTLTALLSKSGKVGFLGGADVLVIKRIEHGWKQGVLYANPKAQILSEYIAGKDDFSGFAKPDVAKQLTAKMYNDGAEPLYAAAGGSGLGAIEAAKLSKKLLLTTGTDQRYLAPDAVVTSRIKNMSAAVFTLINDLKIGKYKAGARELDYKSGGISLAPYEGALVPSDVVIKFKTIVADMDAGKITVDPYKP
jgi:basic membrane protein A